MLIAQKKIKENIAEYILYMYQIEDVIRAYKFDLDAILENYVKPQLPDESFVSQYSKWYSGLINNMISQRIEKSGHLHEINEVMIEISYLHTTLINIVKDEKYKALFENALPNLNDFKEKSNLKDKNDIELAFHALYMKLLLRLQKKEISAESEEAFDTMRILLAYLARAYHQMKNGSIDFINN
jgi:hypothetical protein